MSTARLPLAAWSLLAREWLRFLRQRNRILGALGTPILFWVFFGSGFGSSFRPPGSDQGIDYMTWFFPGALLLVILFTAIFSSISIIEDRNAGFLQGVLVAPVPRLAIVLGKVLGGATLGTVQGLLLLPLAPLTGIVLDVGTVLAVAGELLLISVTLSALGFLFAWRMDSVQGFHAVMNLLLFPMWLLSGAFFPASAASGWLRLLMAVNPLSYGLAALRAALGDAASLEKLGVPGAGLSLTVLTAAAAAMIALAAWAVRQPEA
jgi:ABC-2 type transport system permease protein